VGKAEVVAGLTLDLPVALPVALLQIRLLVELSAVALEQVEEAVELPVGVA
jgi:hypothetical protein